MDQRLHIQAWTRSNTLSFIGKDEVHDILHAFHDEPCASHFSTKRTTYKVLQVRYYWPTLHKDIKEYVSHYDESQRMGKPTKRDEIPLQMHVSLEPFEKCGLDFVGPINPPSNQKEHLLVCTNYLKIMGKIKVNKKCQRIKGRRVRSWGGMALEEIENYISIGI
jgi:hypothetical protein